MVLMLKQGFMDFHKRFKSSVPDQDTSLNRLYYPEMRLWLCLRFIGVKVYR